MGGTESIIHKVRKYPTNDIHETFYKYTNGLLSEIIDGQGIVNKFEYGINRMPSKKITAPNTSSQYVCFAHEWDYCKNRISMSRDNDGIEVNYTYDMRGRLIEKLYPDGSTETMDYSIDSNGLDVLVKTSNCPVDGIYRVVEYSSDPIGYMHTFRRIDPNDSSKFYEITDLTDYKKRVVSTSDTHGHNWQYEYNFHGDCTKIIDPVGNITEMEYDNFGKITVERAIKSSGTYEKIFDYFPGYALGRVTMQNGEVIENEYDSLLRVTKIRNVTLNQAESIHYSGFTTDYFRSFNNEEPYQHVRIERTPIGLRSKYTVFNGQEAKEYTFSYNEAGQETVILFPCGQTEEFVYSEGHLVESTDRRGIRTRIASRDSMARPTRLEVDNCSIGTQWVDFTYSGLRKTLISNQYSKSITSNGFDVVNIVTTVNVNGSYIKQREVENTIPIADRREITRLVGGESIEYTLNLKRMPTSIKIGNEILSESKYVDGDKLGERTIGNFAKSEYSYNQNGRLFEIVHKELASGSEECIWRECIGYDSGDRIVERTRIDTNRRKEIEYSNKNELSSWSLFVNDQLERRELYNSDGKRNLLSQIIDNDQRILDYSIDDRIIGDSHAPPPSYSSSGNTLENYQYQYKYDYLNRLIWIKNKMSGEVTEIVYDDTGNILLMTRRIDDDIIDEERRAYDLRNRLFCIENHESTLYFTYGARENEVICAIDIDSGEMHANLNDYKLSTCCWIRKDSLGSISRGEVEFSPYGDILQETGASGFKQFAGHEYFEEHGMYFMKARWYSPYIMRFINEDPIRHGVNYFSYCSNSPICRIDPTGKRSLKVGVYGSNIAGGPMTGLRLVSEPIALRIYGVSDTVKRLEKLSKANGGAKIKKLSIYGHGGPGQQSCGSNNKPCQTISLPDIFRKPNLYKRLCNIMEKNGHVWLRGCRVGKGLKGRMLLHMLSLICDKGITFHAYTGNVHWGIWTWIYTGTHVTDEDGLLGFPKDPDRGVTVVGRVLKWFDDLFR